jgi:riboflavin kinase/FMN adenylyltransferase
MRVPRAAVVTIGVFDGFHRGHAAVVARARARAAEAAARLVVFTFDEPPRAVLSGRPAPPRLALLGEKVALLRGAEADEVRVLGFNRRLAAKSPHRFLAEHVFPYHRLAALVVGYDFAMGKGRSGDVPHLAELGRELGFSVEGVPAETAGGSPISTTRIRRVLAAGAVEEVGRLLGRPYRLEGRVVTGEGRGRGLGFPTANLAVPGGKQRPGAGVYAVRAVGPGLESVPAVVNIGRRPTFGGDSETVEAHLLDFRGGLEGKVLELEFVSRLRGERKFNNGKELSDQIARDVSRARTLLAGQKVP